MFRDVFALIVGRDFREGIFILPVVLGANVLTGVWLNLSFWYKREEKTSLAIVVTGAGLVSMLVFGFWCIPVWGYYGAAWTRLAAYRRVCRRGARGFRRVRSRDGLRRQ